MAVGNGIPLLNKNSSEGKISGKRFCGYLQTYEYTINLQATEAEESGKKKVVAYYYYY